MVLNVGIYFIFSPLSFGPYRSIIIVDLLYPLIFEVTQKTMSLKTCKND